MIGLWSFAVDLLAVRLEGVGEDMRQLGIGLERFAHLSQRLIHRVLALVAQVQLMADLPSQLFLEACA